jgi:hypothetical protein
MDVSDVDVDVSDTLDASDGMAATTLHVFL